LKKRTKKLLFHKFLALRRRARQVEKSFCFFFQKEVLASCVSVNNNAGWYHAEIAITAASRGVARPSQRARHAPAKVQTLRYGLSRRSAARPACAD